MQHLQEQTTSFLPARGDLLTSHILSQKAAVLSEGRMVSFYYIGGPRIVELLQAEAVS
jgi:hypothetical protein